ncbi:hypothetical protein BKH44_05860 [Helicobacter sp. 13S00477-4]|nr:hypothetical protein BKH44_05860 [Helicobacter sp. 13S00477-4]
MIDIVLKYQKKSGSDLALRMFRYVRAIWNYAFMSGFLKNNPISNIAITQLLDIKFSFLNFFSLRYFTSYPPLWILPIGWSTYPYSIKKPKNLSIIKIFNFFESN